VYRATAEPTTPHRTGAIALLSLCEGANHSDIVGVDAEWEWLQLVETGGAVHAKATNDACTIGDMSPSPIQATFHRHPGMDLPQIKVAI
jgi:hypothetical protein